ncbi:DUF3923 family protein, partial [Apilactobacillus xinyiensis]
LLALFLGGSLFISFRTTDGSGLNNGIEVKIASLLVWIIFCAIIFILYLVIYYFKNRK